MLKSFSMCALLAMLGMGAANAQQREAILQKIDVPNAGFNIVIALPKSGGATAHFRNQPDPNIVYLADGELVYAYTGHLQDLMDIGALLAPACTFQVDRKDFQPRTPVAIYVVPKGDIPLAGASE